MVLTELVRLFDNFDKINHRLRFYCTIDRQSLLNCIVYLSFKTGILLQQPIAPLEGISAALFVYVLHHPQGNERMGDIRSSWVDVITAAGPILLRLGRATTWRCFGAIFEISSGRRKLRIYPNQKNFSQKYFK